MSLSYEVLPTKKTANDLLTVEKKRLTVLNAFIEDRLVKQTTGFYEPIKKQKLSTFSKLKKLVKIQDKVVQLTEEEKNREDNHHDPAQEHWNKGNILLPTLSYSLVLAYSMGTLKKMNKANLMYEQEKNAELSEELLSHLCTIINAMTPVRKIKTAGLT